ncbi:MAG TPA: acylphosphatase [Bacteroidales bacterium]|nr:acylphosphatase [Bacteroidales bacterium]
MRTHVNITVTGRVQKIGFRYSTLEVANQLGIAGFVMNLPDGGVYIEAEGSEENIKTFIGWCHEGPRWANVEHVDVEPSSIKNFSSFEIKMS